MKYNRRNSIYKAENQNKYNNQKIIVNGEKFDSKKEYERYCELKLLERSGHISDLKRQVKFSIIPEVREESTEFYKKGPNKGQPKPGKLKYRERYYIADFVYKENGKKVVEDVKGCKKGAAYEIFKIKKQLMAINYGIDVKEV